MDRRQVAVIGRRAIRLPRVLNFHPIVITCIVPLAGKDMFAGISETEHGATSKEMAEMRTPYRRRVRYCVLAY